MANRNRCAPGEPRLDPVLDFMRILWSIEHQLQRVSKRMESTYGITGPQRLVLRVVGRFPGLSAGELARVVHLHPSTITGIVQRLVRKKLLVRVRHERDSRRVRLRLRPAAGRYTRSGAGTVETAVVRTLRRVPPVRVRHARDVLTALAEEIGEV